MPAFLSNGLFFSRILADNPSNGGFDTDGDGSANKADEFVQIQSQGGAQINLDGIELWSAQRDELFSFNTGDTIGPDGTATIVGQYDGAEPAGFFDAGLPDNNGNQGFLEDGEGSRWDVLFLLDTTTSPPQYITLSYGNVPTPMPFPSGFPTNAVNLGGESISTDFPNGTAVIRDTDGGLTTTNDPTGVDPTNTGPVCFAEGTLIETDEGLRPIEAITVGTRVRTLDHGMQVVRWHGICHLSDDALQARPRLAPIRIAQGALGQGMPHRDLVVSPQHRILVQSRVTDRMFGKSGALVPAVKLLGLPGVTRVPAEGGITYHHLLFDAHEIIWAEGCPAESLLLGPRAQEMLPPESWNEIVEIFPEYARPGQKLVEAILARAARPIPPGPRAKRLVKRHRANQRPLLETFRTDAQHAHG